MLSLAWPRRWRRKWRTGRNGAPQSSPLRRDRPIVDHADRGGRRHRPHSWSGSGRPQSPGTPLDNTIAVEVRISFRDKDVLRVRPSTADLGLDINGMPSSSLAQSSRWCSVKFGSKIILVVDGRVFNFTWVRRVFPLNMSCLCHGHSFLKGFSDLI